MRDLMRDTISSKIGYIAGSISGIVQVFLSQPFDIVKVRLQAQQNSQQSVQKVIKSIVNHEGLSSFYKGTTAPLLGITGITSIQFGGYEKMKTALKKKNNLSTDNQLSFAQVALSGSFGCLSASVLTIPVEHIRIRMQLQQAGAKSYSSALSCFNYILQQYGIRGVYKAAGPTLVRDVFFGVKYGLYETFKNHITTENEYEKMALQLIGGSISGVVIWACIFPIDSIKSKLQGDNLHNPKFRSTLHCIASSNLSSLYKGISPCLVRAVPVNMGGFFTYETVKSYLQTQNPVERLMF